MKKLLLYNLTTFIFCSIANFSFAQHQNFITVRKYNDSQQLANADSVYREHRHGICTNTDTYGLAILAILTRIGYTNFKGNFLHIGFKIPINRYLKWYAGTLVNMGYIDKSFIALPEIQIYRKLFQGNGKLESNTIYVGAAISPYYYSPRVVVGNILTAELGYNVEFNKPKHHSTEGFYFKVGFDLFN